jgi:hypothetical protein
MFTMYRRPWIAIVVCAAIAITFLFWPYLSKSRPDESKVSAAEDEVYEVVVRDMVTPINGEFHISLLVFDDAVLTDFSNGTDIESCEETARKSLRLESSKPLYDSLADKVYRFFASSTYDDSLRPDTIQNFPKKAARPVASLKYSTLICHGLS